jgi:hypothetical protein
LVGVVRVLSLLRVFLVVLGSNLVILSESREVVGILLLSSHDSQILFFFFVLIPGNFFLLSMHKYIPFDNYILPFPVSKKYGLLILMLLWFIIIDITII